MRLSLLVAIVLTTSVAAQEPLAIGIMRKDGLLLPLARLDGDSISSLMVFDPRANSRFPMAPETAGLENRRWTLWKRSGPDEIRLTGRVFSDFGYTFHEVWKTTFKGQAFPEYVVPIPKAGLATTDGVVEMPEDVASQPDASSQRAGRLISALAHSKEAEMLRTDAEHLLHGYSAADRAKTVVRLTKLWRRRTADTDTYYFEAIKQYGHLPMLTTGWIVVSKNKATSRDVTIASADDSYKQGVFRIVLGVVPFRNRELWVMESHYYEGESYSINEWPSGNCAWSFADSGC